ncbi:MAG: UDP-N-acetylglucosamine 2-epimerase (non-hydrolyzing) [Lentisphaerae bacterium]|nr:UDP-N-acetylglucosamine 2-epimerase (non-hydrolyzing) [Lentisphaerota bacterium]
MRVLSVVGARPNFMKIAPFVHALRAQKDAACVHRLVHTGQHYDAAMSRSFFSALDIPEPDVDLGVGSGTHAEQVGRTMIAFEPVVRDWRPDWIVVVGDVNATCACALTARKEHVRLAHIEAGLRSFDETMPEEINRIVTDRLAHLLFTPDALADRNLAAEGTAPERIRRVGNIMIDTLERHRAAAAALDPQAVAGAAAAADGGFAVLTLHRPATVDCRDRLVPLVRLLADELSAELPVIWALHPRTRKQLDAFGLRAAVETAPGLKLIEPIGYREMLRLNMGARLMLTDSGGLQEECCVLGTPCITLRPNTERPVTLQEHGGTCILAGHDPAAVRAAFRRLRDAPRKPFRPPLWDGHTAERIVAALAGAAGPAAT